MAVGSSLVVLGLAKGKVTCKSTRTAIKVELHNVSNGLSSEALLFGTVGLNEERKGLGNTNGVRKLNTGTLTESGLDDRLGHPTAGVGGGTIDLGGILSREGSTSVGTPSTVGINDNLTSGKTGISLGSTNDELSRGVDVEVAGFLVVDGKSTFSILEGDRFKSLDDNVVVDQVVHFLHGRSDLFLTGVGTTVVLTALFLGTLGIAGFSVLGGDDNSVDLGGFDGSIGVLLVLDGNLGLTIGTEPPEVSRLTDIGKLLSKLGGKQVGEGHA
mmetsp:Transcript_18288/g.25771  ORF Transcript_18288/g.25771 Transcript_18288/m.25771 type:complete len:271 (+) Transcript_18288:367-1179(+)